MPFPSSGTDEQADSHDSVVYPMGVMGGPGRWGPLTKHRVQNGSGKTFWRRGQPDMSFQGQMATVGAFSSLAFRTPSVPGSLSASLVVLSFPLLDLFPFPLTVRGPHSMVLIALLLSSSLLLSLGDFIQLQCFIYHPTPIFSILPTPTQISLVFLIFLVNRQHPILLFRLKL